MKLPVKQGVNANWIVDAEGELVAVAAKELYRIMLIELLNAPLTALPGGSQPKEDDTMKTKVAPMVLALIGTVAIFLSGCSTATKNAINSAYTTLKNDAVQDAGPLAQAGVNLALKKAYKLSPTKTTDAAKAFITMINTDAIPYFSGQPVLAASALSTLLTTKVGAIIPPQVKTVLDFSAVISNITNAITIPGESMLTAAETDIILRALTGAVAGAQAFLDSTQPAAVSPTPPATIQQAVPPGSDAQPFRRYDPIENIPSKVVLGRTYGDRPGEFKWIPGYFDAGYAVYDIGRRVYKLL